jgi:SMC interacting uncharacterized protein involved in chromosome segregation
MALSEHLTYNIGDSLMATTAERLGIVETKVINLDEKLDNIKVDVKEMHDCLDQTRDLLDTKLDTMLEEYRINREKYYQVLDTNKAESALAHKALEEKITNLEKIKTKGTIFLCSIVAFVAGTGYLQMDQVAKIIKALAL